MNCTLDQAMIDNQASMASERDSGRSCQKIKKVKKVAKKKKSTLPKTNEISEAERKTKKKILPRHSPYQCKKPSCLSNVSSSSELFNFNKLIT